MVRIVIAFVLSVLAAAITASLIQTQFNLAALQALSVDIDMATRMETVLYDVLHFSPTIAIFLSVSLLFALPVAAWLGRRRSEPRRWFVLAGMVGLMVAFLVIDTLAPVPTLIAANRTPLGFLLMSACGGLAGWLFHRLWHPQASELAEQLGAQG